MKKKKTSGRVQTIEAKDDDEGEDETGDSDSVYSLDGDCVCDCVGDCEGDCVGDAVGVGSGGRRINRTRKGSASYLSIDVPPMVF